MYTRGDIDAKLNTMVAANAIADFSTRDVTVKSLSTNAGSIAVPRGSFLRTSGPSDPVHSMGHASAYGIKDQDGPFIAGWQGTADTTPMTFSGSVGTINNPGGTGLGPFTVNHAMRWDKAGKAYFPAPVQAQAGVQIGSWIIKEVNGDLRFVKNDAPAFTANQPHFVMTPDGNFMMPRVMAGFQGTTWMAENIANVNANVAKCVTTDQGYEIMDQNDKNNYLRNPRSNYTVNLGAVADTDRNYGTWRFAKR
jgi:hypothetical protein